jgi:hypothetical protein
MRRVIAQLFHQQRGHSYRVDNVRSAFITELALMRGAGYFVGEADPGEVFFAKVLGKERSKMLKTVLVTLKLHVGRHRELF